MRKSIPELLTGAIAGTTTVCFFKGRLEWKLLIGFCAAIFAASLTNPMPSQKLPQRDVLRQSPDSRYWFFPIVGFCWAMIWCATLGHRMLIRYLGWAAIVFTCTGIAADWDYRPFPDLHFAESAARFGAAAPGTMVHIPSCPPGWIMRIVKKIPGCHELLVGRVDRPRPEAKVSGPVNVDVWVAADQPVRRLEILLDRNFLQSFVATFVRPDINSYYPQSRDKYKGWYATIDFSLSVGTR